MINHETLNSRKRKALELFAQNYNCAQAVLGAFADICPFDLDTALAVSCGFGGGVGGLRNLCGAASGMVMLAGLQFCDPHDPNSKKEVFTQVKSMMQAFEARNSSSICKELIAAPGLKEEAANDPLISAEFSGIRPCAKYVLDCVEIVQSHLEQNS